MKNVLIFAALLLSACDGQRAKTSDGIPLAGANVWIDPTHGCHYLVKNGSNSSYTPRLMPDGTQVCDD